MCSLITRLHDRSLCGSGMRRRVIVPSSELQRPCSILVLPWSSTWKPLLASSAYYAAMWEVGDNFFLFIHWSPYVFKWPFQLMHRMSKFDLFQHRKVFFPRGIMLQWSRNSINRFWFIWFRHYLLENYWECCELIGLLLPELPRNCLVARRAQYEIHFCSILAEL